MMIPNLFSRCSIQLTVLCLLAFCWMLQAHAQTSGTRRAQPRPLDAVVAVVNSEVITRQELLSQVEQVRRQLESRRIEVPTSDVLAAQVLERMILDRAQIQMARDYGIRIDDAQLDRAVANVAAERGLSAAEFRARAEREGISWDRVRRDIRNEILQARLREREVDNRVQISEADIDAFISERKQISSENLEYDVAQILVRVAEGASADDIQKRRARAEETLAAASRPGADFAALAATYSDASDAMSGGSLGWRSADRLPQIFLEAVSKLQPGGVALVRSPNGFHVLKLLGQRSADGLPAMGAPVTQTRARHILIRVGDNMGDSEAQKRVADLRVRIAEGTGFADVARQNSADGTAGRGGDLGWILPGDTVPEFERAMNALKPGEVSQPVRTPFGYHLIEVMERRQEAASPERVRMAARQALREQRIEEAWQDWLRQLRDTTWVEYRSDEL
jgi:peptidyl-prolyl cis-trans isomerase SurA